MTPDDQGPTAAEERMLQAFMRRLEATAAADTPRLADASVLWLKARLLQRWEAERQIRRPIELMEPIEIAASVAAAMLLLSWSVPSAFGWLPGLTF